MRLALLALAAALVAMPAAALDIGDADNLPMMPQSARIGFEKYLKSNAHRAFAVGPGGGWAWRANKKSEQDAKAAALKRCALNARHRCVLYAVNGKMVFDRAKWAGSLGPYLSATEAGAAEVGDRVGQRFPDIAFTAPSGAKHKISSFRGKVLFLQLWGTWSTNAHKELPDIRDLRDLVRDDDRIAFAFLPVRETLAEAEAWARKWGVTLPLYDTDSDGGRDLALADGGRIPLNDFTRRFPATYVIDARGVVVFRKIRTARRWRDFAPLLKHVADHAR